tara:strand:- start:509 stop:775 length:267 start_codon:yes stop_codon:yes gene_type:complete
VIQSTAGGDDPGAVSDGGLQRCVGNCCFQASASMNGHAQRILPLWITTGIHQTELINSEVCTESRNAADVQRAGWLNQDNDNQSVQLV